MPLCPSLQAILDKAKENDEFWIDDAKFRFSLKMAEKANQLDLKNSEIAKRIGTSNSYVSKIFRGYANLTIDSMVKIARALECELDISINHITIK